ncbi:antitoxin [Parabacteroides faecis]|nr:antitoxin [Parabacteroides faecis]
MAFMFDKRRVLDRCDQIVESIDLIMQWSKPILSPDDFLLSPEHVLIFDGCVMRLQIIGENIKKIDECTNGELFSEYPEIPWRKVIALRNIISHEYANVDEEIIFAVIRQSLPPLRTVVLKISNMLQI